MSASAYPLIGILGGTFNPIHFGHLRMAQELLDFLGLSEVRFIPSANPPHKTMPSVSAIQRAEMVRLAISDNPGFKLDLVELNRRGPSYTIETLEYLYLKYTQHAICLLMGMDAFMKINTWHRWQSLLNYCHIILVPRGLPQQLTQANLVTAGWFQASFTEKFTDLTKQRNGLITSQQITSLDISSSMIRHLISDGKSIRYITPKSVIEYIHQHHLYS